MKRPAEPSAPESTHRPSRAGVLLGVAVAVAVLAGLGLFLVGKERTVVGPEVPVADEASGEPVITPRGSPQPLRATDDAVSSPELVPEPAPQRPMDRSGDGPVGIHAFPPLGTRPQLTGIIVPEDFELPPGYVRHYQSTDDGQRLAPILMFDPVNPPLDAYGEPIEVPPDRVVPPELAPLGMPIIELELPEPPDSDSRSLRSLLRSG